MCGTRVHVCVCVRLVHTELALPPPLVRRIIPNPTRVLWPRRAPRRRSLPLVRGPRRARRPPHPPPHLTHPAHPTHPTPACPTTSSHSPPPTSQASFLTPSQKSWQARHTGAKIVLRVAILMGFGVLPHLQKPVEVVAPGLTDEHQKVRTRATMRTG